MKYYHNPSFLNVSGIIPELMRLEQLILANDLTNTAFTLNKSGAKAACSLDEPCP